MGLKKIPFNFPGSSRAVERDLHGRDKLTEDAGLPAFLLFFLFFSFLFDCLFGLFVAFTVCEAGKGDSRKASDQQDNDQHLFHTV